MRRPDRSERSRRTTLTSSRTCCGGYVHAHRRDHPALIPHTYFSSAPRSRPGLTTVPIPHLSSLQIRGFLKNKQWETRVAAAKAVSFICEGIHHATVADIAGLEGVSPEVAAAGAEKLAAVKAETKANPGDDDSDADANLKFDEFDIVGVLDTAAPLLASKVGDFDAATADDAKLSKKERLTNWKSQQLPTCSRLTFRSTLPGCQSPTPSFV